MACSIQQTHFPHKKQKIVKKKVRFDDAPPAITVVETLNMENLQNLWYTEEELKSQQKENRRKQVRFASTPAAVAIDESKTEEDLKRSWYTVEELAFIRRNNKATVASVRRDLFADSDKCIRGLERCLSQSGYRKWKQRIMDSTRNVITEQESQRQLGVQDPNAIRNLSTWLSREDVDDALVRTARDAYM